ncbi:MAG TPA: hypothetical protein VG408_08500 [Actinomycetota bacterium]|nr:hypothetical protein [Actinomycetota bacterium]
MKPIVKKALAAVAAKEIYERIQESRRPQKPSALARLAKVGLIAGVAAGAYYGYRAGLFDRLLGRSEDRYEGSLSYQGPREDLGGQTSVGEQTEPVPSPT